jgi:Tfp pilus assembly protein PilV
LKHRGSRGFALISSILIMALLVMVALGMLSLSTVEVRSSQNSKAMAEAQANARMALMIAIGELQKSMGPDQRISANGGILSAPDSSTSTVKNPHWTGVWDSWRAGDAAAGSSATPDSPSEHNTVVGASNNGMHPTYDTNRKDHFREWLVSLDPSKIADISSVNFELDGSVRPSRDSVAVQLVGEGTVGEENLDAERVSASLINAESGRYAWWVGDESQKARIMYDTYEGDTSLTLAEKISRSQAPGSTGTTAVEGLEAVVDEQQLAGLSSFQTLDLIEGATDKAVENYHSVSTVSAGVLADVREGGLKRDLSTLLERKIDINESGDDFMLYKFDAKDGLMGTSKPQEFVPLQDLAAYYQLYDAVSPVASANDPFRTSSERGVQYSSSHLSNGMQLTSVDYGTETYSPIYLREYTALYRQPKVIKVQFLLSLFSEKIEPPLPGGRGYKPNTHELIIGVTPSITLWNPTNLPIMMQMRSNPELVTQMMRLFELPLVVRVNKNDGENVSGFMSLGGMTGWGQLFNLYWSGTYPVRLEPGEVKTMALPYSGDLTNLKGELGNKGHWTRWNSNFFMKTDTYFLGHEAKIGWEPESFILMKSSASPGADNGNAPVNPLTDVDKRHVVDSRLRFKSTDQLQLEIGSSKNASIISYLVTQSSYQDFNEGTVLKGSTFWDRRNTMMGTRANAGAAFNQALFAKGMTNGQTNLLSPSRRGASIIARGASDLGWPFLQYSFQAGAETSADSNGGISGGRQFASRPFLHSSPLHSSPFLDDDDGNALYNFGWNWSVDLINDVYEAPVQTTPDGQGYYGGGYTPESGTTHVIQQEIPVVPPLSIAALSHARLGGWSLSDQEAMEYGELVAQGKTSKYQWLRAVGFGGLYPYTLQAIGNSYAHPQIPADKASTTISRTFDTRDGAKNVTMADHSYLANKALWDEYFFSSITPQPAQVKVFGGSGRTVEEVAADFFLENEAVPNRRIKAYQTHIDEDKLDLLMTEKAVFSDGLADKIASHLMVEGPFNVNSTSVEAWKVFFSSLKAKPVAYLDADAAIQGNDPSLSTAHTGTPVGQTGLAGGAPYSGSPDSPNDPDQWTSSRELSDTEIDELAVAMVKQVKLRGPFLSLSEFINRRLEGDSGDAAERSVKGALQAALDDPAVSINAAFRENDRKFSTDEVRSMNPEFDLAAEGPIAYGSAPYIDQADILRSFAAQLTPRGDTFVIRTYGDSLDSKGNVKAQAWCEAVVQRVPDYVDSSTDTGDEAYKKQVDLQSETNKKFGRKFNIISFRWLNPAEV